MALSGSGRIVIIKRDGHPGSSYPVETGSLTVGSGKDCDIITSKLLPPKQCRITVHPTEAIIKNLTLEHPTYLNGKTFTTKALKHSDSITFGIAKFRWDYDGQLSTPHSSAKKASDKKVSVVVKRTRNNISKRRSEPVSLRKKIEPLETRTRNSVGALQGAHSSKTRQIAVVMPQRRSLVAFENTNPISATPDHSQSTVRSESYNSTVKMRIRKISNPLYDNESRHTLSNGKRRRVEKVEKLDTPVVLDKNKRAALMLLTRRSLSSKKLSISNSLNNSKETPNSSKTLLSNGSKSLPAKISAARQLLDDQMSKTTKISSRQLLDRKKGSIVLKYTLEQHNVSGVEPIVGESPKHPIENSASKTPKTSASPKTVMEKDSVKKSTVPKRSRSTPCPMPDSTKKKMLMKAKVSTPKSSAKDKSSLLLLSSKSLRTRSFTPKTPALSGGKKATPFTNRKLKNKILESVENSVTGSNKSASTENDVSSFILYLTNALNIMNNPEIDLESVTKTPEFKAISDKIKSVEKLMTPIVNTPSPQLLEIGRPPRLSKRKSVSLISKAYLSQSNKTTPRAVIAQSPIISPKHSSPKTDADLTNFIDINTPNLSTLFELKSSTPNDVDRNMGNVVDISPKTRSRKLGVLNLRRSQILITKSKTEPKRKTNLKNDRKSSPILPSKRSSRSAGLEHVSDSSNITDPNVSRNEDELVITPKSSLKPPQEVLKEKHSTAKKPVSKKNIIDHLVRSPEVVKELFKSPVKRILSQSIRQYGDSHVFDDEQDGDSSFELLTRSRRMGKSIVNSSIEPTTNQAVKVNSSDKKSKSPSNNISSRRLLRTPKSPKNDLRHIIGVKKMFKTPKAQNSPLNDLRNVKGLRRIFRSPVKSPLNNLSDFEGIQNLLSPNTTKSPDNSGDLNKIKRLFVSIEECPKVFVSPNVSKKSPNVSKTANSPKNIQGLKKSPETRTKTVTSKLNDSNNLGGVGRLLRTPSIKRSPKNDLRDIRGVKKLLKTPNTQKSPENDLSDVKGVKRLLKTPNAKKSPKNDLRDVKGVQRLLKTPKPKKSPKNDLRDVKGVKRLLQTPKHTMKSAQNTPDLSGLSKLFEPSKSESVKVNEENTSSASNHEMYNYSLGRSPLKNYSRDHIVSRGSVLENVGLIPNKVYHALKSGECSMDIKNNITPNRSLRRGTIDKTNYSLEISKVNSCIKQSSDHADNSNISMCHSTPAAGKSKIGKSEIDVKQISPIISKSRVRGRELRQKNLLDKKSPKKTRAKLSKLKVEVVDVKNEDQIPDEVSGATSTKTRTRSRVVHTKKIEEVANTIKLEVDVKDSKKSAKVSNAVKNQVNKKKVTFALSAEKSVDVPKSTKTTRSSRAKTDSVVITKITRKSTSTVKQVSVTGKEKVGKISKPKAAVSVKVSPKRKVVKSNVLKVKLPTKSKTETTSTKSLTSTKSKLPAKKSKETTEEKTTSEVKKITKIVSKVEKSSVKKSPIARRSTRSTALAKKN
ncbi:uncharacterized protein LOC143918868 [Arctopsyche grandis]|uniref:uncharacterized protein LOC143918868 n=1 Tax=Arctopsyche grandis TaxID=121162 RepID=UPI00406DA38B